MNRLKRTLQLITLVVFISFPSYGQDLPPEDENAIPVDGGIGLLVAAGALFGIKKLKEKK